MEHLSLEIFDLEAGAGGEYGSKFAFLPEDASVTITKTSEIFASGDVWSYSFTLNIPANAHIFGSAGDIHGSRLHDIIHKRKARLWAEKIPLYLGYLTLEDEADVDKDGNIDVSFESGHKTFEEMIDGASAQQVPMLGNVKIGVALWRERWINVGAELKASAKLSDGKSTGSEIITHTVRPSIAGDDDERKTVFVSDGENDTNSVQPYPRMVFPKGTFKDYTTDEEYTVDCVNTDYPYTEDDKGTPTHPYCNVALCYQKQGYERTDEHGRVEINYNEEPEAQRGYEYMPANRVNSAPNFYVIYWLRALMKHLGIYIDENQMMDVEDLRRLFFVNTNCDYKKPKHLRGPEYDFSFGKYKFASYGGRLVPEQFGEETKDFTGKKGLSITKKLIKTDKCCMQCDGFHVDDVWYVPDAPQLPTPADITEINIDVSEIAAMTNEVVQLYREKNSLLHDAYATSKCFPNANISDVIKAIEDGFGVRFIFNDDFKRVRIVLIRNTFLDESIQDIACDIFGNDEKVENVIRGFRMTYGESEDTSFYYKGFADKMPHKKKLWPDPDDKHDYSKWELDARYGDIINRVSAFDTTCFVTPSTGNAYVIKIDKDAKRYYELYPSLFENAGFMDAEDGDCTGEDETISTVTVGFKPAIMNDLNMEEERKNPEAQNQRFALFVDDQMRPRRPDLKDGTDYNDPDAVYDVDGVLYAKKDGKYVFGDMMADDGVIKPGEFAITSDTNMSQSDLHTTLSERVPYSVYDPTHSQWVVKWATCYWRCTLGIKGYINEGYRLYLQDNFEPNDDGIAPIESHDWGLTLGIMRGSGDDAGVRYWNDYKDGEGNETWDIIPGSSATAHADTCDNYGNMWDYNGAGSQSSTVNTAQEALEKLQELFAGSNAPFFIPGSGYVRYVTIVPIEDDRSYIHHALIAVSRSISGSLDVNSIQLLRGLSVYDIMATDISGAKLIIELDSSEERGKTFMDLCNKAYGGSTSNMVIDNGVGSLYGRFSLKLRAEKLNPYFDPKQPESAENSRYLTIDNENLRGRGLCDQFYKEYSFWVRNARIVKRTVRMEMAQLLAIDMTKRVKVGDVTGFVRKMQYTVSGKTGLGMVTMEIMYI